VLDDDHRVVDGKDAATVLVRVKEALEDPAPLVLDRWGGSGRLRTVAASSILPSSYST
jgi:hypothetical protein